MSEILELARNVLRSEGTAVLLVADDLADQKFALNTIVTTITNHCGEGHGRLVVTGIGKAGHISKKLSSTFASTGTPSFFLHPAEAKHGDLGMVQASDIILAVSNSGSSEEVLALIPSLRRIGCTILALVGPGSSPLARLADHFLAIGHIIEACPLGLAPSTSTTALLALGDAIALTVQRQRSFTPEQYARYHPGGALGRKLMTCAEAMRAGDRVAAIAGHTTVFAALQAITKARTGSAMIIDDHGLLRGIFTDGDLRRVLTDAGDPGAIFNTAIEQHATIPCRHIGGSELLQSALHLCSEHKINELPVTNADGQLIGLLDLQDLVDRGFEIGH